MTITPRFRRMAAVAVLAVSLAACSRSSGSDGQGTHRATTTLASHPDGGVEVPPKLAGQRGIFKDVDVKSCELGPGPVKANGTVTNTADKTLDVVLTVRWVNPKGNGVIDTDTAVLRHIPAGQRAAWSAKGKADPKKKAVCSFSVVAGTAK